MLTEYCLIDSNIWYYSYILPARPDFMEVHEMASAFLSKKLQEKSTIIAISLY